MAKVTIKSFLSTLFVFFLFSSFYSQDIVKDKKFEVVNIAFYNLENLFDTLDTKDVRDTEFTPSGSKGWNSDRYALKLEHLSSVISQLGIKGSAPDIIGVCEIENKSVLEDLIATEKLKEYNYDIVHYNSPDRRGIDVALLYKKDKFIPESSKQIPLILEHDSSFKSRDQLLVSGKLDNETFHFIVAHWPSRRGGEKKSMPNRIQAAKNARLAFDSIIAEEPKAKVILMGDLNDDPNSPSVKTYLKSNGKIEKMEDGDLFNPMYSYYKKGIGTLAWRDSWNLFDQMIMTPALLDKNNKGYHYYGTRIFNEAFLKQLEGQYKGYPYRTFVGNSFMGGYSDHFPVYIYLVKEVETN